MKQDQRSKTARVAAVMLMAKERGRPVTRQVARSAVQARLEMVYYIAMGRSYAWAWGYDN